MRVEVPAHVVLGPDAALGEYVILGELPAGRSLESATAIIGARARIRSHTVIYAGNTIGDDFQTGHGTLVREDNVIGHGVSVGSHSIIEHHVEIGDGVRIHSNVFVPEFTVLEAGCWIGPGVVMTNARYPRSRDVKSTLKGPRVMSGAKVGAGAVLLPGVTIGRDALVGAGSVVVKDVPDGAVVLGNPARQCKRVVDLGAYDLP